MNMHSPKPVASASLSNTIDGLDELRALLEAINMMASDLEAYQANALSRVAIVGQEMVDRLKERLESDAAMSC
ncbi:hypothetical protein [Ancylobacter oerskovii]|uniref:Uncharacterized protein n=1 Tax=Ancylobacter oerskovii TaxID=459519 RepID=A0ABW4Z2R1_9HYPH|nr:hypothetical protein [Ancylobacter oerskovii]MBS7546285.1 hypothetical protein [Ancylobacter oerskovii]